MKLPLSAWYLYSYKSITFSIATNTFTHGCKTSTEIDLKWVSDILLSRFTGAQLATTLMYHGYIVAFVCLITRYSWKSDFSFFDYFLFETVHCCIGGDVSRQFSDVLFIGNALRICVCCLLSILRKYFPTSNSMLITYKCNKLSSIHIEDRKGQREKNDEVGKRDRDYLRTSRVRFIYSQYFKVEHLQVGVHNYGPCFIAFASVISLIAQQCRNRAKMFAGEVCRNCSKMAVACSLKQRKFFQTNF